MLGLARLIVGLVSAALLVGGLLIAIEAPGGPLAGLAPALAGAVGLAVVVFERMRYRSDLAETAPPAARSPGGDAPSEPLEARFAPTDEVFVDPTSGRRMRVHLDSRTGERRYRAED